jgi:hypothetical protein
MGGRMKDWFEFWLGASVFAMVLFWLLNKYGVL